MVYPTFVTKFTTTSAEEDILQTQAGIRARLKERLGLTTDEQLNTLIAEKRIKMEFVLLFAGANKVSINNGLWNDLIEDTVYSSGGEVYVDSVKIQSATSGTIMVDIR